MLLIYQNIINILLVVYFYIFYHTHLSPNITITYHLLISKELHYYFNGVTHEIKL